MRFDSHFRLFCPLLGLILLAGPALPTGGVASAKPAIMAAPPAAPPDAELARQLDALLKPLFPADRPGAAVLVARNGTPIYRRGFGLADLAKKTPIAPENPFRIGSVTKQFTAALVMRLVEQGKIGLTDPITKYLPDYPMQGKTITVENLLTHTSGIANYTALPAWQPLMNQPITHEKMIDLFKNEPLTFPPGEGWSYSNSGYYLLGVIIEKVTGKSYEENLKSEIFGPLGMTHSGYGRDQPSLPGEVHGYSGAADKLAPADSLSMTQPYAAGSIVASVDDLLKWDNAINAGKVLKPESLKQTFTPYLQKSGKTSNYGYGWLMGNVEGHPTQWHNGGINGFVSHVTRIPDEHLYLAVLVNNETPAIDADFLATKLESILLGKPLPEPGAFTLTDAQLERYVGVYQADSTNIRIISREGNKLYSQRKGAGKLEVFPTSDSTFAFLERAARLTFTKDAAGKFTRVRLSQSGLEIPYDRTNQPIPTGPTVVALTPAQLDACVGQYALAPTFSITVTHEGTTLMAQATGQSKFEVFPESPTKFFFKVVEAQLEFQPGANGKMESMVLHQGGQHLPGKRVE